MTNFILNLPHYFSKLLAKHRSFKSDHAANRFAHSIPGILLYTVIFSPLVLLSFWAFLPFILPYWLHIFNDMSWGLKYKKPTKEIIIKDGEPLENYIFGKNHEI